MKPYAHVIFFYRELAEKLISERKAIEEKDEMADEKELMKALGKVNGIFNVESQSFS